MKVLTFKPAAKTSTEAENSKVLPFKSRKSKKRVKVNMEALRVRALADQVVTLTGEVESLRGTVMKLLNLLKKTK